MQVINASPGRRSTKATLSNEHRRGNGLKVEVSHDDDDDNDDNDDDSNPEFAETLRKHREMIREMKKKYRVSPSFARRNFESPRHFDYSHLSDDFSRTKTTIQPSPSTKSQIWSTLPGSPEKCHHVLLPPSHQKMKSRSFRRLEDIEESNKKEVFWREERFVKEVSQYNDDDFSRLIKGSSPPQSVIPQHESSGLIAVSAEVDDSIHRHEPSCDGDSSHDDFFDSFELPKEDENLFFEEFFDCISNSQSLDRVEEELANDISSPLIVKNDNDDVLGSQQLVESSVQNHEHNLEKIEDRSGARSISVFGNADEIKCENDVPSFATAQSPQHETEEEPFRIDSSFIENVKEEECESSVENIQDNHVEEHRSWTSVLNFFANTKKEEGFRDSIQHRSGTQLGYHADEGPFRSDSSFIENVKEEECQSSVENVQDDYVEKHQSQTTGVLSFLNPKKEEEVQDSAQDRPGTQVGHHLGEESIRSDSCFTENVTEEKIEKHVESIYGASNNENLSQEIEVSSLVTARKEDELERSVQDQLETHNRQNFDEELSSSSITKGNDSEDFVSADCDDDELERSVQDPPETHDRQNFDKELSSSSRSEGNDSEDFVSADCDDDELDCSVPDHRETHDRQNFDEELPSSSISGGNDAEDFVSVDCDDQYLNFLQELRRKNEMESHLYWDQDQMVGEGDSDLNDALSDSKPQTIVDSSTIQATGVCSGLNTNGADRNIQDQGINKDTDGHIDEGIDGRTDGHFSLPKILTETMEVENKDESNSELLAMEDKQKIDNILEEHTQKIDHILADFFESVEAMNAKDERVCHDDSFESYEEDPKMSSTSHRETKSEGVKDKLTEQIHDADEIPVSISLIAENDSTIVETAMPLFPVERSEEEMRYESKQNDSKVDMILAPERGNNELGEKFKMSLSSVERMEHELDEDTKQFDIEVTLPRSPRTARSEELKIEEESEHADIEVELPQSSAETKEKETNETSKQTDVNVILPRSPIQNEEWKKGKFKETDFDSEMVNEKGKTGPPVEEIFEQNIVEVELPQSCVEREEGEMGETSVQAYGGVKFPHSPIQSEEGRKEELKQNDIETEMPLSLIERDETSKQADIEVKLPRFATRSEEWKDTELKQMEAEIPLSLIGGVKEKACLPVQCQEMKGADVFKQTEIETKMTLSPVHRDAGRTLEESNQSRVGMGMPFDPMQREEENLGEEFTQTDTVDEMPLSPVKSCEERIPLSSIRRDKETIGGEFKQNNAKVEIPPSPLQSEKEKIDEMLVDFFQTMAAIDEDDVKPTEEKVVHTMLSSVCTEFTTRLTTAHTPSPDQTPIRSTSRPGDHLDFAVRTPINTPPRLGESRSNLSDPTPIRSIQQLSDDQSGGSLQDPFLPRKSKTKTKSIFVLASFKSLNESRSRIASPDFNQSLSDASEKHLSTTTTADSTRPHDPIATVLSRDSSDDDTFLVQSDSRDTQLEAYGNEESSIINLDSTRPHDPIATVLSKDLSERNIFRVEEERQHDKRGKEEKMVVDIEIPTPHGHNSTMPSQDSSETDSVCMEVGSQDHQRGQGESLGSDLDSPRPHDPIAAMLSQESAENDSARVVAGTRSQLVGDIDSPRPHDPVATVLSRKSPSGTVNPFQDNIEDNPLDGEQKGKALVDDSDSPRPHDPITTVLSQSLSTDLVDTTTDTPLDVHSMLENSRDTLLRDRDIEETLFDDDEDIDGRTDGHSNPPKFLTETTEVENEDESNSELIAREDKQKIDNMLEEHTQKIDTVDSIQDQGTDEDTDGHNNDGIGEDIDGRTDGHSNLPKFLTETMEIENEDESNSELQAKEYKQKIDNILEEEFVSVDCDDQYLNFLRELRLKNEMESDLFSDQDQMLGGEDLDLNDALSDSKPPTIVNSSTAEATGLCSGLNTNEAVENIQDQGPNKNTDGRINEGIDDNIDGRRPHDSVTAVVSQDLSDNGVRVEEGGQGTPLADRSNEKAVVGGIDSSRPDDPKPIVPLQLSIGTGVNRVLGNIHDVTLEPESVPVEEKLVGTVDANLLMQAVDDKAAAREDSVAKLDDDSTNQMPRFEQDSVSEMSFSPVSSPKAGPKDSVVAAAASRPALPVVMSYSCDSDEHPRDGFGTKVQSKQTSVDSIEMPPEVRKTTSKLPAPSSVLLTPERRRLSLPSKIPFHRTQERLSVGSPIRLRREQRSRTPSTPHRVETSRSPFYRRDGGRSSADGGSVISWYTSPGRCSSIGSPHHLLRGADRTSIESSSLRGGASSIRSPLPGTPLGTKDERHRSPMRNENDANTSNSYSCSVIGYESPKRSTTHQESPIRGFHSLASPPRSPAVSLFSRMPHGRRSAIRKLQGIEKTNVDDLLSLDTIRVCKNKFVYNLHPKPGPCDRCWALARPEERERFRVRGSHLCIAKTRSGCDRTCAIFPPDDDDDDDASAPVRLCRQCFFATHKQENSRLQVFRGNNVKVIPSSY